MWRCVSVCVWSLGGPQLLPGALQSSFILRSQCSRAFTPTDGTTPSLCLSCVTQSTHTHTALYATHYNQQLSLQPTHTHICMQKWLIHAAISCHTSHSLSLSVHFEVKLSVSGVWRKCWVCLCKTHHQHARVSTDNWLLRCSECFLSCCYAVVRMGYWATIKRVLPELWYSGIIVGYLGPYEICFIFSPDTILFFSGFRFNGLIWFFVKCNHFRVKIVSK